MRISGIYKIQSQIKPERIYIGSAIDINHRWKMHINDLRKNKHSSIKLQRHFNKYGEADLQFSILLGCEKEDLIKTEQYFIDSYNPFFNICKTAGSSLGYRHSAESRKKQSDSHKKMSNETRQKLSESKKGRILSEETRKKMSESQLGKKRYPLTDEHKKKISESMKGLKQSIETKDKRSKSLMGRKRKPFTLEHRKNLGEAHKKRIA